MSFFDDDPETEHYWPKLEKLGRVIRVWARYATGYSWPRGMDEMPRLNSRSALRYIGMWRGVMEHDAVRDFSIRLRAEYDAWNPNASNLHPDVTVYARSEYQKLERNIRVDFQGTLPPMINRHYKVMMELLERVVVDATWIVFNRYEDPQEKMEDLIAESYAKIGA